MSYLTIWLKEKMAGLMNIAWILKHKGNRYWNRL